MVKGLDEFARWFAPYRDQYVLIGGTAAELAMTDFGLDFRATKDLDLVLHVEALTPAFGTAFWAFVEAGGYAVREHAATGKRQLFRFQKPAEPHFPAMLELFCRTPDGLDIQGYTFAPIPFGEDVSSLSAIVMDDHYYRFVIEGRRQAGAVPYISADRLIPLKALAWLNLRQVRADGGQVDSRNIDKHLFDVMRLSQLLGEEPATELSSDMASDLRHFLEQVAAQAPAMPSDLTTTESLDDLLARIARSFGLTPMSA